MDKPSSTSSGLWSELKRRKVVRVGVVYLVVAWAVIQIADTTFPSLNIPDWALSLVVMCVILGFPVAVVLAWAFELTPDGIRTTKSARQEQDDTPVSKTQQRKRNWMAYGIGAAVPTVIFGVVAGFFYLRTDPPPSLPSTISDLPSSMEDRSIAVIPLTNMSPDPENAFFADGVQEDILTNLSLVKDLRVISRTSTLKYRDTDLNMRQIGEELGVHYLLEGSVRRAGNEVLVTVQLIDAITDEHIWAENYNRTLDNIFAIQAEIAKTIASKLHAVISPQGLELIERRPTTNQEAYDFYLKGRNNRIRYTEEGIAFSEQAVALDPEFVEAWAQLAKQLILTWRVQHFRDFPERLERAKLALNTAKRLGPDLPTTLNAENMFAYNLSYDLEAGIEILLRALELTPNSTEVLNNLAYRYMQIGRLAEAQHFVEKSVEVDPHNLSASLRSIRLRSMLGQWEQLEIRIQECESRVPDYPAWERIRVENQYIQRGGMAGFISAMKTIPDFETGPDGQLWFSLVSRDFTGAIRLIDTGKTREDFGFFYHANYYGPEEVLRFRTSELLKALVLFEMGNLEAAREAANEAAKFYESILENDPGQPKYRAALAIVDALNGDRESMQRRRAEVDELTESVNWNYLAKSACEARFAVAHLILGDNEKAIELLEAATQIDSQIFYNRVLELWFVFDRLRGNPRFEALLED